MMKKLVKKELLGDFGGVSRRVPRAGRRRQGVEMDRNGSDSDDHHFNVMKFNIPSDYVSPSLFKDAGGGEREEPSVAKRLNLSIIEEPVENHPILIEGDNKQELIATHAIQEHVGVEDNQAPSPIRAEDVPVEAEQRQAFEEGPYGNTINPLSEQMQFSNAPGLVITDY